MKSRLFLISVCLLLLTACNLPRQSAPAVNPPPLTPTGATPLATSPFATRPPALPILVETVTPLPPNVDAFFARCPTAAEIAAVNQNLTLTFERDPTAGTLACEASRGSADLTPLQKRAYQSVLIMQQLRFNRPLPWTDKPLYAWFTATIKGLRFNPAFSNSHCCDPADVIDIRVADNSYLLLTDAWIDPPLGGGLQDTMVLYVHEARHNEGLPHTCSNGVDDQTIAELGAWGVQYNLLLWLAQNSGPDFLRAPGSDPDLYRKIALQDAMDIQRSHFCNLPTVTPGPEPTLAPE